MHKITISLTFFITMVLTLCLGNVATVHAQVAEVEGVEMEEFPITALGTSIDNPCGAGEIGDLEGTIYAVFLGVEVEKPSGLEFEREYQQLRGSGTGVTDNGDLYLIRLRATVDEDCSIDDIPDADYEACLVAHYTLRSRTAPNFTLTGVIKVLGNEMVLQNVNATCQSTGDVAF